MHIYDHKNILSASLKRLEWKPIKQIKSSLFSWYYAEACSEWRGLSSRHSACTTQKRPSDGELSATLSDLTGAGIEI